MKKQVFCACSALALAMLLCSTPGFSQDITGKWWGLLTFNAFEIRLALQIDQDSTGYSAQLNSPDQLTGWTPIEVFEFNDPKVKFEKTGWNLRYEGSVDLQYQTITGTFYQYDNIKELILTRDSLPPVECGIAEIQSKYTKKEVYIPMRDGVKLFTSYYMPKDTTRAYPILFYRTPYGIEWSPDGFNGLMTVYCRFTKENYIMAFQDVRGRFMSEGQFEDMRPFNPEKRSDKDIDEASDTYDAVDWLVKNVPHNSGKVGVYGISYPGFYSTMAILSAHPAIKAVSPQAPATAWFIGDDFHHNGAMFLMDAFSFYKFFEEERETPYRFGGSGFDMPVQDNYQFFLEQGSLGSIKKKYFGDSVKFWNDAFTHPDYDDFWKSRDPQQHLEKVKPAVMTVGGWFDAEDLYGTLHTYEAIEKQNPARHHNFLVMGPWSHAQWCVGSTENLGNIYWGQDAGKPFHELEVEFFNHYLYGEGKEDFAEATIFITGENRWTTFDNWPPENAEERNLYFQAGGKLSFEPPAESSSFDEYMTDPGKPVPYAEKVHQQRTAEYMTDDQRFASKRPDVMVYKTDTLTEDITLVGPLTAQLFVSTTGTDADYIVKLIDVFPEDFENFSGQEDDVVMGGYQMLVRAEVLRGKYRNSFENPEPFVPGEITKVTFELPDIAHMFKKGHCIMVQVQHSWFPLVDRNPQKFINIYTCSDDDFQKAMQRIYHDTKHASNLRVNVLVNDE
jgi:uncharacterized protein